MIPFKKSHVLAATIISGLAIGGVAMATGGAPPERGPVPPGKSGTARAQKVAPPLASRFALLRRERDARDVLPPEAASSRPVPRTERDGLVVEALGLELVEGRFGLNAGLSRRARNTSPKVPAYVIPGNGTLCLAGGDLGVSCIPDDRAGQAFDSAVCGSVPSGRVAVYGLVPDGASDVALELEDGSRVPQTVEGNLLYALADLTSESGVPVAVTWTETGDAITVPVPEQDPAVVCNPAG